MKRLLTACLPLIFACHAYAGEPPVPLYEGMAYTDVLKAKGAPLEKDIHESSRIAFWKYQDSTLKFVNGKLVSQAKPLKQQEVVAHQQNAQTPPKKKLKHAISQKDVDDILSAIPNEGPEGSAPAAPNSGSPFQTGQVAEPEEE